MSAEIVNLRRHRKRKARQQREETAEQNRISFGRTKAEKAATDALNKRKRTEHAQKRLDRPGKPQRPKP
ncbi:DUF4169 family protein [Hoeflea poritis]|uniref:DUF4169 family protein n=1 Tax=Hoeflea poritis TaxID=2993659 RepID=A0ABT4VP35_9HYPH|nr:DUF4169 family protein [Hoeflea poritis]MDA4846449.1 DUF4169 family protein [Hoeflea poritis]